MTTGPQRRRVSPIFFLLLLITGLMVGFAAFVVLSTVLGAIGV